MICSNLTQFLVTNFTSYSSINNNKIITLYTKVRVPLKTRTTYVMNSSPNKTNSHYHKGNHKYLSPKQSTSSSQLFQITSLERLPPLIQMRSTIVDLLSNNTKKGSNNGSKEQSRRESDQSSTFDKPLRITQIQSQTYNYRQFRQLEVSKQAIIDGQISDENHTPQSCKLRKRSSMMEDRRSIFQDLRFKLQLSDTSSQEGNHLTKASYNSPSQITRDHRLPPIQIYEQTIESPLESDVSPYYPPVKTLKTQSWRAGKFKITQIRTPVTLKNENNILSYHPQSMMEALAINDQSPLQNETSPHQIDTSPLQLDYHSDQTLSDTDGEEYNIFQKEPLNQDDKKSRVIHLLELMKYRYETYEENKNERQPISCYDIIKLSQQQFQLIFQGMQKNIKNAGGSILVVKKYFGLIFETSPNFEVLQFCRSIEET